MDFVMVDDLAIEQRGNGLNALHYACAASDGTAPHPSSKTRTGRTTATREKARTVYGPVCRPSTFPGHPRRGDGGFARSAALIFIILYCLMNICYLPGDDDIDAADIQDAWGKTLKV